MDLVRSPSPETIASHLRNAIRSKVADTHVCHFNRCKIINLSIEIHKKDNVYAIKTPYMKCPEWIGSDTMVDRVYSIYLCKNTGKIHYCHSNCDGERMTNEDNCQVCCVSGIQYQSEITRSWKISARCVPTVIANKQDPYMFSRDKDGRVKLTGAHNLKLTQCVMIAKDTIHKLLFSKCRMRNEMHKCHENRKDAEKVVNKYKRYCDRNNIVKNYIHMITLYISSIQKRPLYTNLIKKTDDQQAEIINKKYSVVDRVLEDDIIENAIGSGNAVSFFIQDICPFLFVYYEVWIVHEQHCDNGKISLFRMCLARSKHIGFVWYF